MHTPTRITAPILLLTVGMLLAGCGGSGAALESVPEWIANKPDREQAMFGVGTGTAPSLQSAIDKSKMRAQGDIASSLEAQFQSMTKDFREQAGDEELSQFTQAQEQIVSQILRGVTTAEQKILREEGRFRVYTMMQMPIGQAAEKFLSQLQTNREMYTRFRSSEAFDQMRKRVEEYEERRSQPDAPQK